MSLAVNQAHFVLDRLTWQNCNYFIKANRRIGALSIIIVTSLRIAHKVEA
jgi:hypothetical protein